MDVEVVGDTVECLPLNSGHERLSELMHERIGTEKEGTPIRRAPRQDLRQAFTNVTFGNRKLG